MLRYILIIFLGNLLVGHVAVADGGKCRQSVIPDRLARVYHTGKLTELLRSPIRWESFHSYRAQYDSMGLAGLKEIPFPVSNEGRLAFIEVLVKKENLKNGYGAMGLTKAELHEIIPIVRKWSSSGGISQADIVLLFSTLYVRNHTRFWTGKDWKERLTFRDSAIISNFKARLRYRAQTQNAFQVLSEMNMLGWVQKSRTSGAEFRSDMVLTQMQKEGRRIESIELDDVLTSSAHSPWARRWELTKAKLGALGRLSLKALNPLGHIDRLTGGRVMFRIYLFSFLTFVLNDLNKSTVPMELAFFSKADTVELLLNHRDQVRLLEGEPIMDPELRNDWRRTYLFEPHTALIMKLREFQRDREARRQ